MLIKTGLRHGHASRTFMRVYLVHMVKRVERVLVVFVVLPKCWQRMVVQGNVSLCLIHVLHWELSALPHEIE